MLPSNSDALAVVTGAGSGIGAAFARQLHRAGYRLLLVDHSREKLDLISAELLETSGEASVQTEVQYEVVDLTIRDEVEALANKLSSFSNVELLINNAGFGSLEDFIDVDIQRHVDMVTIHIETPLRLVHAVLPLMKQRNVGAIVNVSSLGAFAPCSQAVQYASTKAYLVVFSEALQEELRGAGVRVQALCPGFVKTDFHSSGAMRNFRNHKIPSNLWTTPDEVATCSLRSLAFNRVVVIPGWQSRMLGLVMRMVLLKPFVRIATRPKRVANPESLAMRVS